MTSRYKLIVEYLKAFEQKLDDTQEIALKFPDYDGQFLLLSTMSGGEDFIAFELQNTDGSKFSIIQNYSQLNFAIVSETKENPSKPARRVGFRTDEISLNL